MDELSDKDLSRGYWFLLHRHQLNNAAISFVGIIALGLVLYSGWQFMNYLANQRAEEESIRLLVSSSVNTTEYNQRNAPQDLEIGKVVAVPDDNNKYDLIAQVKNPNLKWAAQQVDFSFRAFGQSFPGQSFVLPLEDKYFIKLAVPFDKFPSQAAVSIDNIKWQRIRDFKNFNLPSFAVTEEVIDAVSGTTGQTRLSTRLKFVLTNSSPYSYWQVPVTVVLTSNSHVGAVGQQVLPSLDSGQAVSLEFYWPRQDFAADKLIVKPEVNILDPSVVKSLF
ncbi:MAG: hypothetical protein WC621_04555 [Patescibacteria group bacterium]